VLADVVQIATIGHASAPKVSTDIGYDTDKRRFVAVMKSHREGGIELSGTREIS